MVELQEQVFSLVTENQELRRENQRLSEQLAKRGLEVGHHGDGRLFSPAALTPHGVTRDRGGVGHHIGWPQFPC